MPIVNQHGNKIYRIVLTGGPSGGKTSALSRIVSHFTDFGFVVLVINETSTELRTNGVTINDSIDPVVFQRMLVEEQLFKEDLYTRAADNFDQDVLILCDRGVLDGRAYTESKAFDRILANNGLTEDDAFDRYDAVVHLVTAALGEYGQYAGKSNNAVRVEESDDAAIAADKRTMEAWGGARRFFVVGNDVDFDGKMKRVLNIISNILQLPTTRMGADRKYLIEYPHVLPQTLEYRTARLEQRYLDGSSDGLERMIRCKTTSDNVPRCTESVKRDVAEENGLRLCEESIISKHQYDKQSQRQQDGTRVILKKCISFIEDGRHYRLDLFDGEEEYAILKTQMFDDEVGRIALPKWINVISDVTYDKRYRNYSVARRDTLLPEQSK